MLSELREFCLESAEALSKGVDYLVGKKKRYIKIADLCLSVHQKQSKIDDQFQKKQLDPTDKDVAEFELYVNHIKEESKKLEEDMKKMDEMSAELKRITVKTAEELKKRQGEDLRVKKEVAPAKQLPSLSTAPAVRDRLAANVPNVQLNRAVQDSNLRFAPYGLSGRLAGSRAENSFGPTHFSRYREDLNTPRALAPPLENFTAPTVRNRVFQAANVPSVQSNIPVPTNTIIAFGDRGKNEIWRRGTNKWTEWEKGRDCEQWYACVKAHSNIYIIGGWRGGQLYSSETDIYDISKEEWSKGPQLKTGRSKAAASFDVYNSQIIVVGGVSNGISLNSVESLKVDGQGRPTGGWETVTPMISKRDWCAAAVLDGKLFVSGGYTDGGTTASVEMLDLSSAASKWKQCAPMREERRCHAMIAFNNQLFVFGGYDGPNKLASCEKGSCDKFEDNKTAELYNPDRDEWTQLEGPLLTTLIGATRCVSW